VLGVWLRLPLSRSIHCPLIINYTNINKSPTHSPKKAAKMMSPCHQKSTFFSSSLCYKDKTHKESSLRKQTPFGLRGWLPRCVIMMNGAWQAVEWYCFGGPGERSRFSILPKFFFRYVASVLPVFSACGPLFLHAPMKQYASFLFARRARIICWPLPK
jgi:hypothetical protein